jgi:hypothetical protein
VSSLIHERIRFDAVDWWGPRSNGGVSTAITPVECAATLGALEHLAWAIRLLDQLVPRRMQSLDDPINVSNCAA